MKVQVIIPTAGIGSRFQSKIPKPFIKLLNKPLFVYCLEAFERSRLVNGVVLVVHPEKVEQFREVVRKYRLKKITKIVIGGNSRRESVANGLKAIDLETDIVLVHDGVRPFLTSQKIDELIMACKTEQAVTLAVKVKPTIKEVDPKDLYVQRTLDREKLWEIQTPQAFQRDVLWKAHQQRFDAEPTDDAAMAEKLGYKVKILPGSYENIKITTPIDLLLAKLLLKNNKK